MSDRQDAIIRDFNAAVDDFIRIVEGVEPARWSQPRAPGKWSPEQITVHVTLAYELFLRELNEGVGLRIRTKWWQRIFLRTVVLPRVLKGFIPEGAPAPKDSRPEPIVESGNHGTREECVERLRQRSGEFLEAALEARRSRPRVRLTHPYFGMLGLDDGLRFVTAHTRHHGGQVRIGIRGTARP